MEEPEEKYVWQVPKVGDWVVTDKGEVGQVTIPDWGRGDGLGNLCFVKFKANVVASVRMKKTLTFIDPAFHKLLTSVNKEEL